MVEQAVCVLRHDRDGRQRHRRVLGADELSQAQCERRCNSHYERVERAQADHVAYECDPVLPALPVEQLDVARS